MTADMIFIFLLALILFGPKKLPEIARQIGKFMAEFRRASNDFTSQLQAEIEKTGSDVAPSGSSSLFNQENASTFAQTLLPPTVKSAISDIDSAHDRLMQTARMAFDAQNFTLRTPDAPVIASGQPTAAAPPLPSETNVAESSATAAPHESSPVEAATDQSTQVPAPTNSGSAQQSS